MVTYAESTTSPRGRARGKASRHENEGEKSTQGPMHLKSVATRKRGGQEEAKRGSRWMTKPAAASIWVRVEWELVYARLSQRAFQDAAADRKESVNTHKDTANRPQNDVGNSLGLYVLQSGFNKE